MDNKLSLSTVQADAVIAKVKEYSREIAIVFFVLVGGLSLLSYLDYKEQRSQQQAWQAYFLAQHNNQQSDNIKQIAAFKAVAREHTATRAAKFALLRTASLASRTAGQSTKAKEALNKFLAAGKSPFFSDIANLFLAKCLLNEVNTAMAKAKLSLCRKPFLQPQVALTYAHCLLAEAQKASSDPRLYKQKLESAREGYLRADATGERGWPAAVTELSAFALVMVQDRIDNPTAESQPKLMPTQTKSQTSVSSPASQKQTPGVAAKQPKPKADK